VEVLSAGASAWVPARPSHILDVGDQVRTLSQSRAILKLADEGAIRLRESSRMGFRPPRPTQSRPIVEVFQGFFHFFSRGKALELEIQNRLVSAGTLGTEFHVIASDDQQLEIAVFEGQVELRTSKGQITVASGQCGTARPGILPTATALIEAVNVIQWCLYYPSVLDVDELPLNNAEKDLLNASLLAFRSGQVKQALALYPAERAPGSEAERVYRAALLLSVGAVDQAQTLLDGAAGRSPLGASLLQLIAAVKGQPWTRAAEPQLASEWLAESYYRQSQANTQSDALDQARKAAAAAVAQAPQSGPAWARLAELEFSFGRTDAAHRALDQALRLAPEHAQAVALRGFVLSAENRIAAALTEFDRAISLDSALGNAWLGRGLCRIRRGHTHEGRDDLLVAAALEPRRAVLRSYLGKAYSETRDSARAAKELRLATQLDPRDPTGWLYSALAKHQENRVNEAIRDLERSKAENDNRSLYRSRLLLDQDRAVRSANLARIYDEAGMTEVAYREAVRAVSSDYGNYSAHLFLANSYDQLRDPNLFDLRFETAANTEYLLANLLAPPDAGTLSPAISQQEFSRFFQRDRLGLHSATEYLSRGAWTQAAGQYGILGNAAYSLDGFFRSGPGQGPNAAVEQWMLAASIKQQIGSQDSVFATVRHFESENGDTAQRYDPSIGSPDYHYKEFLEPMVNVGYHHEWRPGAHTLFLASYVSARLVLTNSTQPTLAAFRPGGQWMAVQRIGLNELLRFAPSVGSAELQQILEGPTWSTVVGGRYQYGDWQVRNHQANPPPQYGPLFDPDAPAALQDESSMMRTWSVYGYQTLRVIEPLQLIAGLSYDNTAFPENTLNAPVSSASERLDLLAPKAGVVWTPAARTTLRGAYTRSLAGADLDASLALEPSQVAGFTQAYRSLAPESVVGAQPGMSFETFGISLEQSLAFGTYLGLGGELLFSDGDRSLGGFDAIPPAPALWAVPMQFREHIEYRERALTASVSQLIGDRLTIGARYRLAESGLESSIEDVPPDMAADGFAPRQSLESVLHQIGLDAVFNHPSGLFARLEALWNLQTNHDDLAPLGRDDFWHFNVLAGYRFAHRRAEIAVGVLNLFDQDYRLSPLTPHRDLAHERTAVVRLRLDF